MKKLHCWLGQIMEERNLTASKLAKLAGVTRGAIKQMEKNDFKRLDADVVGRVCHALDIGRPDEFFSMYDENIWLPILVHRSVTFHLASSSEPTPPPSARGAKHGVWIDRSAIGAWDVRAMKVIWDHLNKLGPNIKIDLREHVAGIHIGPAPHAAIDDVFAQGNHVVIGSPIANPFAEEFVCRVFNAPPYTPGRRDSFPYHFVWESIRSRPSSFGWQGMGKEFGIWSTRNNDLVATRTLVAQGEGDDCALIVVYRIFTKPKDRLYGRNDQRIVIAFLGHSGPGTEGAAQVAINSKSAAALYPKRYSSPLVGLVKAKYQRDAIGSSFDNRRVTEATLADTFENQQTPPVSRARATGRR